MGTAVLGARVLLAVVFATAGVAKLLDRQGTRTALEGFGVPRWAISPGAILLPVAELATAIALIPRPSAQWGGLAALVLLLGFIGGITNALAKGQAPDCHCFGQLHSEPAGRSTLIRNIVLAAGAGFILVEGPGPSLTAWVADRNAAEPAAIAAAIAAVTLGAFAASFWRENRKLQQRLDDAVAEIASLPPGLPVGSLAPDFELSTVQGGTVSLEALRARGRPVALVFVSPGCGPCATLLPEVARWQDSLAGDLTVALISTGTSEENRAAVRDSATDVLLQEESETFEAYRIQATPSTVVVTREGRIGSAPATGPGRTESLIRLTLRRSTHERQPQGELRSAPPVG